MKALAMHLLQVHWKVVGSHRRANQGIAKGTIPSKHRKEGKFVFGGGITMKLTEMTKGDLLNAEAGETDGEDQGNYVLGPSTRKGGDSRRAGNRT